MTASKGILVSLSYRQKVLSDNSFPASVDVPFCPHGSRSERTADNNESFLNDRLDI
jgi:hypothetical protein